MELKRNIKIFYAEFLDSKGQVSPYKIFFSTKLARDGAETLSIYKARFQMEFNLRDGKQFAGLVHRQGWVLNKLNFHFNASLTSINIAKCKIRNEKI